MKFNLKPGLILGGATAATQIEGGDTNNNWYRFAAEGKIYDGTTPCDAGGHYRRVDEDTAIMSSLGLRVYRMGIEWSRIEPNQGEFSEQALAHYRSEIEGLIKAGIRPMLTLHHFTNPLWFEDMGGFTHKDSPDIFMNFATKVVDYLGDLVADYITINEPNVYSTNSLFYGTWPPEKKSLTALIKAYSNLTACHIRAYNMIHEKREKLGFKREETLVSFANHLRVFAPKNPKNIFHRLSATFTEYLFQGCLTRSFMEGKCFFPVLKRRGVKRGKYYDYIGINYYSRSTVSGIGDGTRENCPKNDLGWEIYHEGLIELSDSLYKKYKAPIFVTENGTCDNTDAFRSLFIYDQLKLISETENHIERYYHWSVFDNFEWREGESSRFGLVHVDYRTEERTIKKSGHFYADIIKNGGVTDEAYETYVSGEKYNVK